MLFLTLDRSAPESVAALFRDGSCIWRKKWESAIARNPQWLTELVAELPVELTSVEAFYAGTGPGSFSGIRGGISVLQGLALPRKKSLFGVGSIAALAWRLQTENPLVVGDARRGLIWVYDGSFRLVKPEVFVPGGRKVYSPEAARVAALTGCEISSALPEPEDIGNYVLAHPDAVLTDPVPVYLQPAV